MTSDTPNGTHSLASGYQVVSERESQQLAPEEHNVNGLVTGQEKASSEQEPTGACAEEEEEREGTLQSSQVATPHPPSLVQRDSSSADTSANEESQSAVRTVPPALVGYEAVNREVRVEEERGEMEADDGVSLQPAEGKEGGRDATATELQERDTREESPDLVIDTCGSQQGAEGTPLISKPETESSDKHKHIGVNLATRNSQVSSEPAVIGRDDPIGQPDSPRSSSGNEDDVELDMDIIEEGEEEDGETPPTAPPPKGVLMMASNAMAVSQAHVQPHVGISPSHTVSRLAMENLKKGEPVRKPNVIVASPSSGGGPSSIVDLTRGGGGQNPSREGGGGSESGKDRQSVVSDSFRVRQVAKVKQFFTTLQQFGNKNGSEVAEQVQELITAVVVRK